MMEARIAELQLDGFDYTVLSANWKVNAGPAVAYVIGSGPDGRADRRSFCARYWNGTLTLFEWINDNWVTKGAPSDEVKRLFDHAVAQIPHLEWKRDS